MNTRLLAIVFVIGLSSSALTAPASAAPGQPIPTVQIALVAHLITPTLVMVTVSYTCQPEPSTTGDLLVTVTQSAPIESAANSDVPITCDGAGHTQDVPVPGGPTFAPGNAFASALACTVLACGMDARKIVIE